MPDRGNGGPWEWRTLGVVSRYRHSNLRTNTDCNRDRWWRPESLPVLTESVFLCSNGHVPRGPGLACTRMSPFWILELRMMEVVVRPGAIRRAKLQSSRPHQQTNTNQCCLQAGCLCCQTVSGHWRINFPKMSSKEMQRSPNLPIKINLFKPTEILIIYKNVVKLFLIQTLSFTQKC